MTKGLPDDKYIETLEAEVSAYLERIRELEQELQQYKHALEGYLPTLNSRNKRITELEQENATLRNAKCLKCGKSLAPDGDCYACECDRLHLQLASAIDMANTCCREHGLRESNNVKPGIERLAWKCTELRQQIARTEEG